MRFLHCRHCDEYVELASMPTEMEEQVARLHVGPGKPRFAENEVVATLMTHVDARHQPIRHAWIEGRDYEVVDQ